MQQFDASIFTFTANEYRLQISIIGPEKPYKSISSI